MRKFWISFISVILCIGIVSSVYGEIKLEVWNSDHNPDTQKWYKEVLVPAFEKSHPGVKVEMVFTPWLPQLREKITTSYAAGLGPDIIMGGAAMVDEFVIQKIVIDITDKVKQWSEYKNFIPATTENQKFKGRIYGVPLTTDSRHFLYRKDLFAEVGLNPNKPPTTWEQFREAALKLTKREGNTVVRLGCDITLTSQPFDSMVYQNSGRLPIGPNKEIYINTPEAVEALEWWGKLYNEIAPPGTVLTAPIPLFAAGKIAMAQWTGTPTIADVRKYAPQILDKVGIAPPLKGKYQLVLCFNNWWGIGSQSKHPDLAWEFIKFHLRPLYIAQYAQTLYRLPANSAALNLPILAKDPFYRILRRQREQYGIARWTAPEVLNITNAIDKELESFLRGKKSAKQALDDAANAIKKILDQYKKFYE
ncbi:ABC transporter substrate-binding protein [bacterium]|nr:ABC transporter substrate-binding protein [bacterium]